MQLMSLWPAMICKHPEAWNDWRTVVTPLGFIPNPTRIRQRVGTPRVTEQIWGPTHGHRPYVSLVYKLQPPSGSCCRRTTRTIIFGVISIQ
ncbi:hypothetical protein GDO81_026554 [Engystomops pustulosus]|uniref:Uncharacterized protein n=1 Tax=Engystomops pustulosus TaxID=76066 RepID=A0AAV6YH76_ENGPU|nr:hypothetical protein GDO81_026196 [Engystomops pustulosus]KAG8548130.1 hypothetical protein GDO81_026554 [Engystomops pustulosus]KAG8548131.1 hypothetical protein GDO81_026554 [Engystomops pustulosus]KAG8548132.1 hypothetical protein GDO81_026554 [Engystomops pustulosus]KAG8548133.1 hypothetical protein GDO81_026554 [Engystomops pustulosus]